MNKSIKKKIIIACSVGIPIVLVAAIFFPWTFIPVKSSPKSLTVTFFDGYFSNKPVITLRHYIRNQLITEYTLVIETGVYIHEVQKYELPELNEGSVEVIIQLGDLKNSNFSFSFEQAEKFFKKGLLIYLTENDSDGITVNRLVSYDRYAYFVCGNDEQCYVNKANSSEWSLITNAPALKNIKRNEPAPYIVNYSGWKENKWVTTEVNDLTS